MHAACLARRFNSSRTGVVRQRISMGLKDEASLLVPYRKIVDSAAATANFLKTVPGAGLAFTRSASTVPGQLGNAVSRGNAFPPLPAVANQREFYSTTVPVHSKYAAIDHSEAYEMAMRGRHGQQLALARLEGVGKDDPPFDPFLEEELLKAQAALEENNVLDADDQEVDTEDVDEGYYADVSEDEGDEFEDEMNEYYNPDGSIRRKKSVLATLRAGYPAGGLFAIVELGGSQHKVTTDDVIVVNRLKPVEDFKIGSVHTLKNIMLLGSTHLTLVGLPYVNGAEVDVMVEEITQDAKVIIFKKRRRKNSQRKNGYRRDLTLLRVLDIRLPEEYKNHKFVGRDSVDELDSDTTVVETESKTGPSVTARKRFETKAEATEEETLKTA
mmetsp:Transcript_17093/g.31605  ORF Transcript_17093/g.31605 Transcript_17093/m.31605 type:complete len:385 (+) Transcript_17093:177-1331(+)